MRTVSAADANREFSKILREVREGESVTVTSHGAPVAVISPAHNAERPGQSAAKAALLGRLRSQKAAAVTWTRNDLYED